MPACVEPDSKNGLFRVRFPDGGISGVLNISRAMAKGPSRPSDPAARPRGSARSRRGFVTMTLRLPRYVISKSLADGTIGFYFNVPTRYRKRGCSIPNEPLGNDYATACGADGNGGRAAALNGLLDEWLKIKKGEAIDSIARYGTVDWLFREYKASKRYREHVS
jgi:hypothetical protein